MTTIHKKFEIWFAELTALVYRRKYVAFACMLLMTFALASQTANGLNMEQYSGSLQRMTLLTGGV